MRVETIKKNLEMVEPVRVRWEKWSKKMILDSEARKSEIGKRTRKSQKDNKYGKLGIVKPEKPEPENKARKLKSVNPKKF